MNPLTSTRRITEIHLHHEGGGTELNDVADVERGALSRTDQRFRCMPYHFLIMRPVTLADALDQPTGNLWELREGRPVDEMPASSTGRNAHAVAVCVAGRWDREPLPGFALDRLVEACAWLCRSFGLGAADIYGHREIAEPGHTVCPGYDPAVVRARVEEVLRAGH